jgi:hypothetical protein
VCLQLFVTGFTGRDMEVKQTKFGPIGTFSLAVRGIKDTTDWFNVELLNAVSSPCISSI